MVSFNYRNSEQDDNYDSPIDQGSSPYKNFSNLNDNRYPTIDFNEQQKQDLMRFQLELTSTKSEISHWLNGDTPDEDPNTGKIKWKINAKDEYKVLNDFGIREVMRILNMYLTKDIIMSNLKEERINKICEDVGYEINDLFFTKYDEIGLDTDSKLKNYSSIVVTLVHVIYITLMRAEGGKEREGVNQNKVVTESMNYNSDQPRGFNLFHPFKGGGGGKKW